MSRHSWSDGFSLIEVLIALAVLAVVMATIVRASGQAAVANHDLQEQTLAGWVAANVIEQVRLRESWPSIGRRQGRTAMGQREWHWQMEISQTEEARMRRLEVTVFRDKERRQAVTSLSGFVGLGRGAGG